MPSDTIQPSSEDSLLFVRTFNWLLGDAHTQLQEKKEPNDLNTYVNSVVYPRICLVLAHPLFEDRPPKAQIFFIQNAHRLLIAVASRMSAQVATLAANTARKIMRDPTVSIIAKIGLFNTIYHLFWQADSMVFGVAPVNAAVVRPLSDFLKEALSGQEPFRPATRSHARPRIGYLVNFTEILAVAAGTSLFVSIINGHALAFPDHDIFIYTYGGGDLVPLDTALEKSKVVHRHVVVGEEEQELWELRDRIRADDLDYLITEAATGVATYLYESRCALRQVYAYMGFCCWKIRNLDLVYGFTFPWRDWMGFDPRTYLMGPVALEWSRSLRDVTPDELSVVRAHFPPNTKILCFFGRFTKVTEVYLRIVERILKAHPNTMFFAAGYGDTSIFDDILANSEVAERIRLNRAPVEIGLYGRIVDVMLDTFPFAGGNILREMQFLGKPVVALQTPMMQAHYENTIDPALIARTGDEYEALAGRLLTDQAFYRERSDVARQRGLTATDIKSENGELIRRIMAALPLPPS